MNLQAFAHVDALRAWLRRRVPARVRLPRSLFAKAVALLVVTLGVVSAASVRVFSGELAASAQGELDVRGRALLRALERHEELRLAAALSDAADRIARVTVEQGGAVDQLWKAFQEAFEATREASSGVEQLREASRAIAGRADHMRTLVERYELPEEPR